MLEFAQKFEQMAAGLRPIVLIGPGLASVLVGLLIWLGGLWFRKVLAAVAGAAIGGICGFFLAGQNITWTIGLAIAGAVTAIILGRILAAGSFFWRLVSALCCAALGTGLIFGGMVLLLLYKGAVPVSSIGNRPFFYAALFVVMTAFGTIEQMLFCRRKNKAMTAKKQVRRAREEGSEESLNWRSA